jgi:23S rRNA (uracil747-C5)-methyltransferase
MKCAYFTTNKCKSCDLLSNSYGDSLYIKERDLAQLFPDYSSAIKPTRGLTGDIAGSRNKAKFAVFNHNDRLTLGYYHSDGSYQELENCPLHAENINAILPGLRDVLNQLQIIPYDLKSKTGELKYLIISTSGDGDTAELLMRFVLRSKKTLENLRQGLTAILALSPAIKVISVNIQPIHQAVLEGPEEIVLTSNNFITHVFDEFKLTLGTRSFFQVTSDIAKNLYNSLANAIEIDAPSSFLDLYCGVGAFSFYAARHCRDVTGIELSPEAIHCANYSAQVNKMNIQFEALDVESYLQKVTRYFDAVLFNPPRRGLNTTILERIKKIAPRFIYYSSCNAKTMQRDFQEIRDLYSIKSLQIFDMFPYTKHYESLMCLVKK